MLMIKSQPNQVEVQFACTVMVAVPKHIPTDFHNSFSLQEGGSW